jgi:hypothetical protein
MKRQMIPNFRLGILKTSLFTEAEAVILKPRGDANYCIARR